MEQEYPQTITKFEEVIKNNDLLRGIYGKAWENPSIIQQKGIPIILSKKDCIIQSQSGMGKTGTYLISCLEMNKLDSPCINSVIILPTRELACQVYNDCCELSKNMNINIVKCIGKVQIDTKLTYPNNAVILVGTPGRLTDVLSKNILGIDKKISMLIIDEFDKILDKAFSESISGIFTYITDNTQVVLISATNTSDILTETASFMRDPIKLIMKSEDVVLEGISQFYVNCNSEDDKFSVIMELFETIIVGQSVIFVNSKKTCDILLNKFQKNNFSISLIHGSMEQIERDKIMNLFRDGTIRILLSSDLLSRGIDVPKVSLVINYDLPYDESQYIHRIGRTGRYGKKGISINLIAGAKEEERMKNLEKYYNIKIEVLPENFIEYQ